MSTGDSPARSPDTDDNRSFQRNPRENISSPEGSPQASHDNLVNHAREELSPASSASPSAPRSPASDAIRTPSRSPQQSTRDIQQAAAPSSPYDSEADEDHKLQRRAKNVDLDEVSDGSLFSGPTRKRPRSATGSSGVSDALQSDYEDLADDEPGLPRKFAPYIPKLTTSDSQKLAIAKLPPVIEFCPRPYNIKTFSPNDTAAVLYRLRSGVTEEDIADVAMAGSANSDARMKELVESNSNIVTWSDGSQTLFIGDESYDFLVSNAHDVSQHVFCRHEDIQQANGVVEKRVRIQPSTIKSSRVRVSSQARTPVKRQMMLADVLRAPDIEEKKNARNAQRIAREQAKLAAKRRAVAQRNMSRARTGGLSVSYMEDTEDTDTSSRFKRDVEIDRERESSRMSRLMEVKRGGGAVSREVRVKKRKLAKHKIEDDEDSDKSDESDESESS